MGGSFQYVNKNYMVLEALEEYVLAYVEETYEDPGQQAPMGFVESGGEFHDGNTYHWADQKHPSFTRSTYLYNTNWETADVWTSMAK